MRFLTLRFRLAGLAAGVLAMTAATAEAGLFRRGHRGSSTCQATATATAESSSCGSASAGSSACATAQAQSYTSPTASPCQGGACPAPANRFVIDPATGAWLPVLDSATPAVSGQAVSGQAVSGQALALPRTTTAPLPMPVPPSAADLTGAALEPAAVRAGHQPLWVLDSSGRPALAGWRRADGTLIPRTPADETRPLDAPRK